ncbi:nitroreductase family protein [Shimia sp. MMG029]|uniref:nitroreductase family protein n=1 Tax=Shimia sp. MMG029 TaxID=3021978 RepID=UPI0022FF1DE9|nr:nitroreductase family protein [Shimia sp. MMG029]MDA5556426.1 nitroreductase family protein [Shimia sp. MMG029]
MPQRNQAALDFLLSRRSRPAKTLIGPTPTRTELEPLLEAALRSPDHGKLEPWRLIVLERKALRKLADLIPECGKSLGIAPEKIQKGQDQFANAELAVAVIESPVISEKIPAIEQTYSAACVCLQLLNAALAAGWGANWLSGWASHDRTFVEKGLGLAPHEKVAGFIHIGTEKAAPPERPRPNMETKVTWLLD